MNVESIVVIVIMTVFVVGGLYLNIVSGKATEKLKEDLKQK
ncbi:hypothetical protein [Clostridium sp. 19966]|nr:hypothetical protein [Clostridium sp. 19966]